MITENPKKEFVIAYPIEKVKETIQDLIRIKKPVVYKMDDVLNYYRFGILSMLSTGLLNITISKVDENSTDCKFEMENPTGSNVPTWVLSSMMNSYLDVFSDLVSGKTAVGEKDKSWIVQESKNKGCSVLLMLFFIIALTGIIVYMNH